VSPYLARPEGDADRRLWLEQFEARIREVASRSVAHLARGDQVALRMTSGARVQASARLGGDTILRYLALLEPTRAPELARRPRGT
jgi:hypothetical protein